MAIGTLITLGLGALGITIGTGIGGALLTFGIGLLSATAASAVLNALAPKPKLNAANRGYQVNATGSALDHQVIYGQARVGGVIIYEESVEGQSNDPEIDNQFLLRVYAHAGHPIQGYEDVYFDGRKVTEWRRADQPSVVVGKPSDVANGVPLVPYTTCGVDIKGNVIGNDVEPTSCNNIYAFSTDGNNTRANNVTLRFYNGTQTTADATLVADSNGKWTTDHVLRDIAYMTATMGYDQKVFPNGVPDITCTIKGKKVFDPRSSQTVWSENSALCIRDYLTSSYGLGETSSNIDDVLFSTAANVCDTITTVDSKKRYTCNGAFITSATPFNMLNDLLTSMGGMLWYSQGKWRIKPAYWVTPTLTLTEDDLRSDISVKSRHSRRENFNTVKGTFRGPESSWQVTDYPEVSNSGFISEDNGKVSVIDFDLPFTSNSAEARRLALILLERNRQQITISASFGLRAFSTQVGDIISISLERFGWDQKTFEVAGWSMVPQNNLDIQIQLTLREISEEVFNEINDGVLLNLDNTNLADAFRAAPITNLTAVPSGFVSTDGTFFNSFLVSWQADGNLSSKYEVEWKEQSESTYLSSDVSSKQFQISPVKYGVTYNIRVRSVNPFGIASPWVGITAVGGGDTVAPKPPTNVLGLGTVRRVALNWIEPTQDVNNQTLFDLSVYKVYRNVLNNEAGATYVGSSRGNFYIDEGLLDNTAYYYWVSAVDYSNNESTKAASGPIQTNFISASDLVAGIREDIGAARIDVVGTLPSGVGYLAGDFVYLTTDSKLYEWNGSSWITVAADVGPIPDGSITSLQLGPNSVTAGKIAANAVTSGTIAANSITAAKIATDAVTADKIIANAITTGKISAGAVSADKIAVTSLAAINASLGAITAGSINTVVSGVGLRVNEASFPRAVYTLQNSLSVYGLYASNIAAGGGAFAAQSNGGFSGEFINTNNGSGAFGAYVGLNAQTTGAGGAGQIGVSSVGGSYGFRAVRGGYYDSSGVGYRPFTGSHDAMILKTQTYELGDIVVDYEVLVKKLSDVFTEVRVSDQLNMKSVIGVVSGISPTWSIPASFIDLEATALAQAEHEHSLSEPAAPTVTTHFISDYEDDYDLISVNAVGEGCVNVCGRGGNIQKGDLIVTSTLAGKGQKQSDDIIKSYTVGKAREDCTFSDPDEVKQIACFYFCG